MSKTAFQDAQLLLQLYELRREERLRQARAWFTESFRAQTLQEMNELCPPGSPAHASFRMMISYWEMVASFIVKGAVSDKDLFFENSGELLFVWARVESLLPEFREQFKDPYILKNLEVVAQEFIEWRENRAPGSWEAFKQRINS
ncbi:MAG: hypothetical protein V3T83_10115 [Acidobacteriota bacterium]